MAITNDEILFIKEARKFLDNPSFLVKVASLAGKPFEKISHFIPENVRLRIHTSVEKAMSKGLEAVTQTIVREDRLSFSEASETTRKTGWLHSAAAFGTGAVGGFFGVISLPVELPLTTGLMLRSIVSIAQDFGHDVKSREVQLECLYVLSIGGTTPNSYFASRVAFTDILRQAAREIGGSSAPHLVRFLAQVASRFELVVSEKAVAEIMPVVGAVGGGALNAAFSEHFNQAARYHFGLRALELKYGAESVRAIYDVGR